MNSVGSFEAKTHLARLLERVARGEQFIITKHGVPVARLAPVTPSDREARAAAIDELHEFRRGRKLGRQSIREMIEEGRRH